MTANRYRLLAEFEDRGAWRQLVAVVDRRAYRLAWNGARLARCRELSRLCNRHPGVAEDMAAYLEGIGRRGPLA